MLSLFNFITVHSSYVYLLRNQHKFCKISKNTFFTEHFWVTASGNKHSSIFKSKICENEEAFEWIKCSSQIVLKTVSLLYNNCLHETAN